MRGVAWAIAVLNVLFGFKTLLNAIDRRSKYSRATTWLAVALFLALGGVGVFWMLTGRSVTMALWIGVAPWAAGILLMFLSLTVGNWQ